jgi:hypothetical protein
MADIVNRIPFELSNFGAAGGGSYNLDSYRFDYALGGLPFMSATRDQWPYTEGMAEIRKQQFDSFQEPGEQSLYGWWLRSQSTFNAGAGLLYQDPDNDNQFNYRFQDSLGVDPWTSGSLGLLRQMNVHTPNPLIGAAAKVRGYVRASGTDAAYLVDGANLWNTDNSGSAGVTFASVGSLLDLSVAGNRSLINMTDGLWTNVESAAATKMYSYPSTPTAGAVEYVKGRIGVGIDNIFYLAVINTGATLAIDTNNQFKFTHPDPTWKWTSVTEGPSGIYVAGKNATQSAIYKITIDFSGSSEIFLPTVTATMPTGEFVNDVYVYIGSFVGIATSRGFRVGEFNTYTGDVAYGPLLFQPTGGCHGIVGYDRFMFVGSTNAHDGASGVFRVDLGTQVQEQTTKAVRYAYARDAYAAGKSGTLSSVTMLGASDRLLFTIIQDSIMLQSASTLIDSGYLKTGRIRFNTEEPKLYKFVSLRTPHALDGNVQFSLIDESGSETPYITYGPTFSTNTGDVSTPTPNGRQNWIQLKFTLSRGTDTTKGGVLNGWQVKALPGSTRQRLISHTFLLFDEEMDKGGQRVGGDGYARQRFEDFKMLAKTGDVVVFQELIENLSTLVIIDDWKYTQLGPPGPNASTLGGYLTVVLRTVAEAT